MKEWKINDVVVHKRDGVCRITAIKDMNPGNSGEHPYYVLVPVYDKGTRIYIPADRKTSVLREPLSVDTINRMIGELPDHNPDWVSNEKMRQREFSQVIDNGKTDELLFMVSALRRLRREKIRTGRKFHASDEKFLNDGQKMLHGEFAFQLKIEPEEVPTYIEKHLN